MFNVRRVYRFDNLEAWLDAVQRPSAIPDYQRSSHHEGDDSFRGTRSFAETIALARKGWLEGTQKAKAISERVRADIQTTSHYRKQFRRQVYGGGSLLIDKYLRNEPDCNLHMVKQKAKQFLHVVVSLATSSGISTDVMIARGTVLAGVIDALELRNFRCKITVTLATQAHREGKPIAETYITVKDYNESLDLDRVVFMAAHPSSVRRLYFSFAETWNAEDRQTWDVNSGYGMPEDSTEQGDLYLPKAVYHQSQWATEHAALEYIKGRLAAKNVILD